MTSMPNNPCCPVCSSPNLFDFLEIPRTPIFVGVAWPTAAEVRRAAAGTIVLAYCRHCGFVFNRAFDPNLVQYSPGYEVSLHHSPVYQAFVSGTIEQLVQEYEVHDRQVLEVGCGRGYYLRALCQAGHNRGIGLDPSMDLAAIHLEPGEQVTFERDYYGAAWADTPVDCVVCRHVLQHIVAPQAFLEQLREPNLARPSTLFYLELPNGEYVVQSGATWNVFYEHCSYISPDLLRRMGEAAGYTVLDVQPCFEQGQYMNLHARIGDGQRRAIAPSSETAGIQLADVQRFGEQYRRRLETNRFEAAAALREGKRIVAWGSGGRGVSYLNSVAPNGEIEYVVDINPERQQRFVPGSGQQIVSPADLLAIKPDVIVLTNPTYAAEIEQMVAALGLNPAYLAV